MSGRWVSVVPCAALTGKAYTDFESPERQDESQSGDAPEEDAIACAGLIGSPVERDSGHGEEEDDAERDLRQRGLAWVPLHEQEDRRSDRSCRIVCGSLTAMGYLVKATGRLRLPSTTRTLRSTHSRQPWPHEMAGSIRTT